MSVEITGLDELTKTIVSSGDKAKAKMIVTARRQAEKLAGAARAGCPVDTGQTRNSIRSYVKVDGDKIEAGARSNNPVAVYLEFGTGPVGESGNHPMAAELGITHRPNGWTYQSPKAAAMRGEEYIPGEKGGYVYTEGMAPRAFMYNAMVALEDEITAAVGAAVTEALE